MNGTNFDRGYSCIRYEEVSYFILVELGPGHLSVTISFIPNTGDVYFHLGTCYIRYNAQFEQNNKLHSSSSSSNFNNVRLGECRANRSAVDDHQASMMSTSRSFLTESW